MQIQKKKQYFEEFFNELVQKKLDFTCLKTPSKNIIEYNSIEYVFEERKFQEGDYLCGMVAKNIDKIEIEPIKRNSNLLQSKLITPPKDFATEPLHRFFTNKFLHKIDEKKILSTTQIDINHCYWRTAYLLGYIQKKTYDCGLDENQYVIRTLQEYKDLTEISNEIKYNSIPKEQLKSYLLNLKYNEYKTNLISDVLLKIKAKSKHSRLKAIGFLRQNKFNHIYKSGNCIEKIDVGNVKYRLERQNIVTYI